MSAARPASIRFSILLPNPSSKSSTCCARPASAASPSPKRNSYFHFFRKYVAHCFTPFEGTPLQGVQVLGFLETRALRFERVYLLDANEDVLPDTRKEETLLPFGVREILGLPTYIDRDMLSAYYFETLVKGSGEVHLFFIENERKEKSRFVERLLWERQKRKDGAAAGAYVRSVSLPAEPGERGARPDPEDRFHGRLFAGALPMTPHPSTSISTAPCSSITATCSIWQGRKMSPPISRG